MNKRILAALIAVFLILAAFAGCGSKAKVTSQETLDLINEAGFPMELLPEGVEAEFNQGVLVYGTQSMKFDELKQFYLDRAAEMGTAEGAMDLDTAALLENGLIDQAYVDSGLESWIYNGVVGENSLYVNIEQRQIQLNTTSIVYVAFDKTPDVSASAGGEVPPTNEEYVPEVSEIQTEDEASSETPAE